MGECPQVEGRDCSRNPYPKPSFGLLRWLKSVAVVLTGLAPWIIAGSGAMAGVLYGQGRRGAGLRLLGLSAAAHVARQQLPPSRDPRRVQVVGTLTGDGVQPVRLVSANLWMEAPEIDPLADEVLHQKADIVVLQEVTPPHLRRLERRGLGDTLFERAVWPNNAHSGLGVWSRFPLSDIQWFYLAGELQVKAWVALPNGMQLRVYGVHAPSPVPNKIDRWYAWFASMKREATRELAAHSSPVVIAGDFNATLDHHPFRRLVRTGLSDAALLARRDLEMTWPNRSRLLPPLFRIDHVLLSSDIGIGRYRVGQGRGSDHRPVIADLLVRAHSGSTQSR